MSVLNNTMDRMDHRIEEIETFLAKILLAFQVAIIFSEVVCRYLLGTSLIWSEEMARYLLVWIGFMGASIGLKKKGHFGVELLVMALPTALRKLFTVVTITVMFIFLATITVYGVVMIVTADEVSTVMQVSMRYFYAAIPLGGFFMLFHLFIMVKREGLQNFYKV
jgi:TRAP-type C4-dicarboxylate transport system permease small subunit